MDKVKDIVKLLEVADIYEAASKIIEIVGEELFIAAANGDSKALEEIGSKLIQKSRKIKQGPKVVKDSKFLEILKNLKDR